MSPWFKPSLTPILVAATLLGLSALRARASSVTAPGPSRRRVGLAAYCFSLAAWATSVLLAADPATQTVGERLLMVGFFVPASFLHAVAEDLGWRTRRVPLVYATAVVMTVLGALPAGLFLEQGGTVPGPLFLPMFLLGGVMSGGSVLWLVHFSARADAAHRERHRYLLLAGVLGTFGGGLNVLLMLTGHPSPAGLYVVLLSLVLLAFVVQATRLPAFGRFVEQSLRYSVVAALLTTGLLVALLVWLPPAGGGEAWAWRSWNAGLLLFLSVLVAQPLLATARGWVAGTLFVGQGDVEGVVRALAESEARAEHAERLAQLGTLASAVAHEVRNPLGVIAAAATVLERSGAAQAPVDEIRRQVARAAGFADELLEYGRPAPLNRRAIDLLPIAQSTTGEVGRALALDPAPELVVEGEEAIVQGDMGQVSRLVAVLVENAVLAVYEARTQAPGRGAGRVRVTVAVGPRAGLAGAWIRVEDDGPGVPEAMAADDSLFEAFATGRGRDGPRPGTGLGLAIARGIAHRHGGALVYEGRGHELGGARFAAFLPASPPLPAGT